MWNRASKLIETQCCECILPLSQQVNQEGLDPYFIDRQDTTDSNWMKFVNTARHEEQNVIVYQYHGNIYYRTFKNISPASELLGGYRKHYVKKKIGKDTNTEGKSFFEAHVTLIITSCCFFIHSISCQFLLPWLWRVLYSIFFISYPLETQLNMC